MTGQDRTGHDRTGQDRTRQDRIGQTGRLTRLTAGGQPKLENDQTANCAPSGEIW
eukprot:SAG22_NODE_784_length_7228_cov_10.581620_6_plen_55_part_00